MTQEYWPLRLLRLGGWCVVSVLLIGCFSQEESQPPPNNKNVVTPRGEYVGHLKPDTRLLDALDPDLLQVDPVVWVVDNGQVQHPERDLSVHIFRLDFDEKIPITIDVMPYVLMTEKTKQVVIHRGRPPEGFSNSAINQGERCLPVYLCMNRECPRIAEIDGAAIFPHDPASGHPECPFCNGHEAMIYQTPQHNDMLEFVE